MVRTIVHIQITCPKCGRVVFERTTFPELYLRFEHNLVRCPCGFVGELPELSGEKKEKKQDRMKKQKKEKKHN